MKKPLPTLNEKNFEIFFIKKNKNPEGREKKRIRQAEDGNWNREAKIEDTHAERQEKIVSEKCGRLAETDTRNSVRHDARSSPLSFSRPHCLREKQRR